MKSLSFISFNLALISLTSASPNPPEARSFSLFPVSREANTTSGNVTAACVPAGAVHMIVARASTEAPGEGIIGAVATSVKASLPGSDSEAVEYPATLSDYKNSESSGVAGMQKLIEAYATRCPESKMALLGYSQGAQVAGDVMCGTTEGNFTATQPLSDTLSKNIVAVIQMGDPTHVPKLAQDVGNSTKSGIFPRTNDAACATKMAAIAQSYCNDLDQFCDSGNSIPVHLAYVKIFGTNAADFVVKQAKSTGASSTNAAVQSRLWASPWLCALAVAVSGISLLY